MELQNTYNKFIHSIALPLKQVGFALKGSTYYLMVDGNWGLVDFQKSTESTANIIVFTVNLGIASTRLLQYFSPISPRQKPSIWVCQWQVRLGHLLDAHKDLWWSFESETITENLSKDIQMYILEKGIPEILKNIRDTSLRDLWLSGQSPSLTNYQRLLYLSILIYDLGPHDLLNPILDELKLLSVGKPNALTTELHINKLRRSSM